MDKMKNDLTSLDEDMALSHTVFRSMIALGVFLSGAKFEAFGVKIETAQVLVYGLMAITRAIYKALLGAVETAVKLATWGRVTLDLLANTPKIFEESANALKYAKLGGNVMTAIGVIVDGALLITEAILGAQQRKALREAIVKLAAHRFLAKKIQQEAHGLLVFRTKLNEVALDKAKHDEWVQKGRETQEEANDDLRPDYQDLIAELKRKIGKTTPQDIWDMLDKQFDDNKTAWKNDDPSLSDIEKYVEEWQKAADAKKTVAN